MVKIKHFYYGYLMFFLRYFSWKKFFNLIFNLYEYKTKKIKIKSIPFVFHFDVSNICILNCPLCATGKKDKSQTKGIMSFKDFKNIFDQVKDHLFFVWLYNWGEPFLCKDIFKIVEYCHQSNVGVKLDSNLNYYNDEILKNIVKSKIDYISLSIDGFSQKNYEPYRVNGDLKRVFEGVEKIIFYKKTLGSRYPVLIWQFLINNFNMGEEKKAGEYSKKIGIDIFDSRPLLLYTEIDSRYTTKDYTKFLSKTGVSKEEARTKRVCNSCRYLWCSLVINPNLSFSPCPVIYKDSDTFGSFSNMFSGKIPINISDSINSKMFIESRKRALNREYSPKCAIPCTRCYRLQCDRQVYDR